MDGQKDTRIRAQVEELFDTPDAHTDPFGANQFGNRAYRRTERIVAAVLLATNHIDLSEPLRKSVRATALKCLEEVMQIRDQLRASNSPQVANLLASLRSLISLLRLLAVAGLVSSQNMTILIEAIDGLGLLVESAKQSSLAESVSLARTDFIERSSQKDIKDSNRTSRIGLDSSNAIALVSPSASNARRGSIIDILRRSGAMGIADISSSLPEYSRKMVQRDLADLVKEGRVTKAGSKRWSQYSLPA